MGPKGKLRRRVYGKRPTSKLAPTIKAWTTLLPDSKTPDAERNPAMGSPSRAQSNLRPSPLKLAPPMSQKAATMSVAPSDEDIDTVRMITGIDRDMAIRYLKVKHNDANAAINSIIEGEDISSLEWSSTWDESAWTSDREGGVGTGNDGNLRPLGSSTAPTRGPSPAPSLNVSNPKSQDDENSQLAAAVAASRADMGLPFQQETGVIRKTTPEPTFGPATKAHYEESSWAMVPSSTTEVVPDVDVPYRQHVPGEPRLLKHLPDGDYTPNFLTICHTIPGVRDALLMPDHVQPGYGFDDDWWRGHPIPLPRTVHVADEASREPDQFKHDELIAEVQRLMAFLESSDRRYATVGGLTQTDAVRLNNLTDTRSGTLLELLIQLWSNAAFAKLGPSSEQAALFTTLVGTTSASGLDTPELLLTEMTVNLADGQKSDLSEMLDDLLWDTDPDDTDSPDNYIQRPGDVIVMMVRQRDANTTQLGVEVPAELYLDKYLHENVDATRAVRQRMAQGRQRVAKIEAIERQLTQWPHSKKNTALDARQLLSYTLGHYNGDNRKNVSIGGKTNSPPLDTANLPGHYPEVTAKLEAIIASIDNKLDLLSKEKAKTRKAISDLSKTVPSELEGTKLKHRYTLRGVATKPHITYFLGKKPANDPDVDMESETEDDTTPPGMVWWRAEYDANGAKGRVSMSKAADYDVLRAVELEHNSALLVYASDRICASNDTAPLPQPLIDFITRDNQAFAEEIQNHERSHATTNGMAPGAYDVSLSDIPRESIERTSIDSTRAEGGRSPPSFSFYGSNDLGDEQHDSFTEEFESDMRLDHHDDGMQDPEVHEIKLDDVSDREDEAVLVNRADAA